MKILLPRSEILNAAEMARPEFAAWRRRARWFAEQEREPGAEQLVLVQKVAGQAIRDAAERETVPTGGPHPEPVRR